MTRRVVLKGIAASALLHTIGRAQSISPNPKFYKLAANYSAQRRGISLLVMQQGKLLFEDYPNGGSPTRAHELASGTKSFSALMAIAAQQDGLLRLDEPVAQTLTEWRSDPLRSQITLRQLLHLVSGIPGGSIGQVPTYAEAIQTRAVATAGTRFSYGPLPYQIFGEVMRRKLGGDPLAYLERRIFKPIGLEYARWRRGTDGNPHLPSGAFLTAQNWAKLGELVRLGGVWQGQRIVEGADLEQCFVGTAVNPRYGLTWWLNRPITPEQRTSMGRLAQSTDLETSFLPDLVMAAGAGDQRLYVVRSLGLVVVRQAEGIADALMGRDAGYSDSEFLSLLLLGRNNP